MTLREAIVSFTGLQNALVIDAITGVVFGVGILMIVALLTKFIFRLV